jgi:hypothetical protein
MILKAKKGIASPNSMVWDSKLEKILFTFVDGEFETDDKYIIDFWTAQSGDLPIRDAIVIGLFKMLSSSETKSQNEKGAVKKK